MVKIIIWARSKVHWNQWQSIDFSEIWIRPYQIQVLLNGICKQNWKIYLMECGHCAIENVVFNEISPFLDGKIQTTTFCFNEKLMFISTFPNYNFFRISTSAKLRYFTSFHPISGQNQTTEFLKGQKFHFLNSSACPFYWQYERELQNYTAEAATFCCVE